MLLMTYPEKLVHLLLNWITMRKALSCRYDAVFFNLITDKKGICYLFVTELI